MKLFSYLLLCVLAKPILSSSSSKSSDVDTSSDTDNSNSGDEKSASKLRRIIKPAMTYDNFLAVFRRYLGNVDSCLNEFEKDTKNVVQACSKLMFQDASDPKRTSATIIRVDILDIEKYYLRFSEISDKMGDFIVKSFGEEYYHIYNDVPDSDKVNSSCLTVKPYDVTRNDFLKAEQLREAKKVYFRELQSLESSSIDLQLAYNNIFGLLEIHKITTKRSLGSEYLEILGLLRNRHFYIFRFFLENMGELELFRNSLLTIHAQK